MSTAPLVKCILPGDPAPWFTARSTISPEFHFDTAAGRRVTMLFFGSLKRPEIIDLLRNFAEHGRELQRRGGYPFGVSADPDDEFHPALAPISEKLTIFWDFDRAISRAFGVARPGKDGAEVFGACTVILDEGLRLLTRIPVDDIADHLPAIIRFLDGLPPVSRRAPIAGTAPVLLVPNVLDRAMCEKLIERWRAENTDSGYMRTGPDGKLVGYIDYGRKRRRDHFLENDDPLYKQLSAIMVRRVKIAALRAFHYDITRVERFCIACYDAAEGGYFKEHRDFADPAYSHRAFAMTLNLNAESYEGGELIFPEFGRHLYKPRTGEAIIFSGWLLHEAMPVTKGRRFAMLSFFYGEKEAAVRNAYKQKHGTEHETVRVTDGDRVDE